jgi:hypothetical protein
MNTVQELQELIDTYRDRKLVRSDVLYFAGWMREQTDDDLAYLLLRAQILDGLQVLGRVDFDLK